MFVIAENLYQRLSESRYGAPVQKSWTNLADASSQQFVLTEHSSASSAIDRPLLGN